MGIIVDATSAGMCMAGQAQTGELTHGEGNLGGRALRLMLAQVLLQLHQHPMQSQHRGPNCQSWRDHLHIQHSATEHGGNSHHTEYSRVPACGPLESGDMLMPFVNSQLLLLSIQQVDVNMLSYSCVVMLAPSW